MFNFVQPIEVIQQRGHKAFIDLLNKACVGNEKSEVDSFHLNQELYGVVIFVIQNML